MSVRVSGVPLSHPPADTGPWRSIRLIGVPAGGLQVDFAVPAGSDRTVHAYDSSYGLPPAFAPQLAARNAVAVPIHGGDATVAQKERRRRGRFPLVASWWSSNAAITARVIFCGSTSGSTSENTVTA